MKREIKQKLKGVKHQLRNMYWQVYGNTLSNPRLPENPRSFLFVCKGNICRSPFAELLARKISNDRGWAGKSFASAGLEVSGLLTPPDQAIQAARGFGVILGEHKSRKIDLKIIKSADMILVMEPWHMKTLRKAYPNIQNKLFLFSLFQKNDIKNFDFYHIPDPYGQSLAQFQACYLTIEKRLLELFLKIGMEKAIRASCHQPPTERSSSAEGSENAQGKFFIDSP